MEAKEFLWRYRDKYREKRILIEQMRDLEDRLVMLRSIDYSKDIIITSPTGDTIPEAVAALVDAQTKLAEHEQEAIAVQREVSEAISKIEDSQEREALYWRYIMNRKMEDIAEIMFVSVRQLYRIMGSAEEHISEMIAR